MLRHWGYTVQTVYDGPSGVRAAVEFHPNAAIVDIGLPGLDGYQVAQKLRDELSQSAPHWSPSAATAATSTANAPPKPASITTSPSPSNPAH